MSKTNFNRQYKVDYYMEVKESESNFYFTCIAEIKDLDVKVEASNFELLNTKLMLEFLIKWGERK